MNISISSLIYNILILILLFSSIFLKSKTNKNKLLTQLSIWLIIIFFGTLIYNNKNNFLNLFTNFIPYIPKEIGERKLKISKTNDNHFYITLKINNKNIIFLIDTGATNTTLTINDAKKIGININNLKFNIPIETANGSNFVAKTKINNIELLNYKIDSLDIFINKNLENSLLGMNFLNTLKGYSVKKDEMILYY